MGKIPDRWLEYRPIGKRVEGTRFIAFKTPLKETFNARLTVQERFTPEQLIKNCPELGVIIDLTNTTKYYGKEEILRRGVEYEKVTCPGQVIPPLDSVMTFFKTVDQFLYRHKNDDTLIGVHCTHGVNRTGYMLSRYLIQRMGIPLSKAVASVEKGRGYKIERPNFIDHLKRCTSPMPMSTYTPEREMNKGSDNIIRGRKGVPRLHDGEDGRGSPRRGDHFPEGRRRRSRSPSPHRSPAKKYDELHQRDKLKFGERSGDPLFDPSDRSAPFSQHDRYGGRHDASGSDLHGGRSTDPWAGPDPPFPRFEDPSQIRFGAKDFDDRKHYLDRMKGDRHYSPVSPAGRSDFKERYPSRHSPWDGDRFPPNFSKSSFSRSETGIPYDSISYDDSFAVEKSGHSKGRKDTFHEDHHYKRDHPPFPESGTWKTGSRLESGGFDKMGHGRRSPFSRDPYSSKADQGWGNSVAADVGSRHFDSKHERSDKPPGLLKHASPPRRSDRSPVGNDKSFRDKRVRPGRDSEKQIRRSRSPFAKSPLFLIEDRKGPSKGDRAFRKRSPSAENLRRFDPDGRDYPGRFPLDEKQFSRLASRLSPPLHSRGGYREPDEYFRSKEEYTSIRVLSIGDRHRPFCDGPRRSAERDIRYHGDKQTARKDDIRHLQDSVKYKKERLRSPSPHRSRYYSKNRLSPIWLRDSPRGRHGTPPKGGSAFGAPDFFPGDERHAPKYRESPDRKALRLQERDLHSGRSSYDRRAKKGTHAGPRADSPRPESAHHPSRGRLPSKRFSPDMPPHYNRAPDRFSPRNETAVMDNIRQDPSYQNQDVDCRNIINQKRFYRPDSANPGKGVFMGDDAENRGRSADINLGPPPVDRRESFERDSDGRIRFLSREQAGRDGAQNYPQDFFVADNDLRKTLQREARDENLSDRHQPADGRRSPFGRSQSRYGSKGRSSRFDFPNDEVVKPGSSRRSRKSREKTPDKPLISLRLGPPPKKSRRDSDKPQTKLFPKEPIKSSSTWRKKSETTSQKRR